MIFLYAAFMQKAFLCCLLTIGALSAAASSGDDGTDPFAGITDLSKVPLVRKDSLRSALHVACICGAPAEKVQELLVQHGSQAANLVDHIGNTPLVLACSRDEIDADVVQVLLDAGAIVTNKILRLAEENGADADLLAFLQAHKKLS